ncbi:MAG: hypothetical protein DRH08_12985 [Deltaproteobacteria bacterium]|nr:MAG: hypothetical protein DRH08_12985 [Deltaproteobacteria bacterium]
MEYFKKNRTRYRVKCKQGGCALHFSLRKG